MKKIFYSFLTFVAVLMVSLFVSNKAQAACPFNCPAINIPTVVLPSLPITIPPCGTCTKLTPAQPSPTSSANATPTPTSTPSNNSGGGSNGGGGGGGSSSSGSSNGSSNSSSSSPAVQSVLGLSGTDAAHPGYLEFAQLAGALFLSLEAYRFFTKNAI